MNTHTRRGTVKAIVAASVVGVATLLSTPSGVAAPTPVPVGTAPKAVITVPDVVWANIPITLSGARSTPSGDISEWEWDLNGKGGYDETSTSTPWVSKSYSAGKHTVKLRVRGGNGLVATTTKTFTAKKPPNATTEPAAPADVTAEADGTTVKVTWTEPLGAQPLTYRVSNDADLDTDPIYVPASDTLAATFGDLVPDTYRVRVVGINRAGTGPGTEATAEVLRKGESASTATATASVAATTTPSATATETAEAASSSASSSGSSSGDNRDTIGIALIAAGGVVLLAAAIAAGTAAWRRRRAS